MLQLKNSTPFQAGIAIYPDQNGVDTLYVTIKGTFNIGKKLSVAEKQQPIVHADTYWGEPGLSSLKYASESHLSKPTTDIILIGEASAPEKRRTEKLDVTFSVGSLKKVVRVFGDRNWAGGIVGVQMTSPKPFESIPLIYERAFGGVHEIDPEKKKVLFEPRNPVGKGFRGKREKKELNGMPLPNLEDPAKLISSPGDQPAPTGFGYIAPSWEPRKSYAGTYDEAWQKNRAPYLPDDFNSRFLNGAHPDLICKGYLKGGEPVEVVNASPYGPLRFKLPTCNIDAAIRVAGVTERPPLKMETVLVEPGQYRFFILWRTAVPCDKKALKVEEIDLKIQNMEMGMGRA
jgi:hypothetical protein